MVVSDIRHPRGFAALILMPERDASAGQVVRGDFDFHAVSNQDTNPEATHVAGERREYGMSIVQGHTECRAREDF
jgi:hypothetical protein